MHLKAYAWKGTVLSLLPAPILHPTPPIGVFVVKLCEKTNCSTRNHAEPKVRMRHVRPFAIVVVKLHNVAVYRSVCAFCVLA